MKHSLITKDLRLKYGLCLCVFLIVYFAGFAQKKDPTPQWRPKYHFTPEKTWTNDPNGLFFFDNTFHLYYQNNPFDNVWGHMSWGHATSPDLLHWKHLPVAIPEINGKDTTISIFSGSAVLDPLNTSGFGQKGKPALVAIFTGDLPKQKKQAQYIAYSNDTGKTFKMYQGNPVIDIDRPDFRDPSVFWYAPAKMWIMVVSLVHEHKIRFYGSSDLKAWSVLSDFGPAGYTGHDWECPFLVSLPVNGHTAETKWVLAISSWGDRGPMMQYFIGGFDGKTFHSDNQDNQTLLVDGGDCFYAAIPWQRANKEPTMIGWLVPGKPETHPWRGQMSIPRDLTLKRTTEGIRLYQEPAAVVLKAFQSLPKSTKSSWKSFKLNSTSWLPKGLVKYDNNAYLLNVDFDVQQATKVGINIAENSTEGNKIIVGYDVTKQMLFIDCAAAKNKYKSSENSLQTMPMKIVDGKVRMQILMDKSSLEVFAGGGRNVMSTMIYPAKEEKGISVFSTGSAVVEQLSIQDLDKASNP